MFKKIIDSKLPQIFAIIAISIYAASFIIKISGIQNFSLFQEYTSLKFTFLYIIQLLVMLTPLLIYKINAPISEILKTNKVSIGKSFLTIISAYIIYIILMIIVKALNLDFIGMGEQQDYLKFFGTDKFSVVISVISVVLVGPIAEEILFRGYLTYRAEKFFSQNTSNIIISAIFASFHLQLNVIISLFILSLVIGNIRNHTNSIYPAIGFHIMNNAIALFAQYSIY